MEYRECTSGIMKTVITQIFLEISQQSICNYRIVPNFRSTLVYVIVWLAVVFGINSVSNAGGNTVIVRGEAEHYYSFPACITRTINSKYYS